MVSPPAETLCAPMLLSSFSHFSFFHMAANMYVLWSFSTSAVSMLGREQFMAVYLSAGTHLAAGIPLIGRLMCITDWFVSSVCSGVVSSFVSYVCKMATGRFGPSLGAVSTNVMSHHDVIITSISWCLIWSWLSSVWSHYDCPGGRVHQNA